MPIMTMGYIMSLIIRLAGKNDDYNIRQQLAAINENLEEIGLLNYKLSPVRIPSDVILPWMNTAKSNINCLKNLYLELQSNPEWTPNNESIFVGERVFFQDLAEEILGENQSHLVWHYNFCSLYIPVDFNNVSVPDDLLMTLGSSINLCNELREIAVRIDLDLGDYNPDLELLYKQRINELEDDSLCLEKMLILYLYNFCLASIKYNLIIEFSG